MRIGVPTETKSGERRVGLTPSGVRELVARGHEVVVESGAGVGAGIDDDAYRARGALVVKEVSDVYERAELIVKVKEPQLDEVALLQDHNVLFTYLHLASSPPLTRALSEHGATCIAYEGVEDARGDLPLLIPMSEIAGRLATQFGSLYLTSSHGRRGILLGGAPGVLPAKVVVIGAGVVGVQAATTAMAMGAAVELLDVNLGRLRQCAERFGSRVATRHASEVAIEEALPGADLVVGAVLVPGARSPRVIRRDQLPALRSGSILVDVSIDQGGCFETSRPTTHENPTYEVDGVLHYCVTNMPAAVADTATRALSAATLPYVLELADRGFLELAQIDDGFAKGIVMVRGAVVWPAVAETAGVPSQGLSEMLVAS